MSRAALAAAALLVSAVAQATPVRFLPVIDGRESSMGEVSLVVRDLNDEPIRVIEDVVSKDKVKLEEGRYDAMLRFLALPTEPVRYVRFEVRGKDEVVVRVEFKTAPVTVVVEPALDPSCTVGVEVENTNSGHKVALKLGQAVVLSLGSPYKARVKASCGGKSLAAAQAFYHDGPRTVTVNPAAQP